LQVTALLKFFQFLPVAAPCFEVNVADVVFHSPNAYVQGFRNFMVAFALLYQIKHFYFPFGKLSVCTQRLA
jgi:hypothetical protein